jgi:ABC-2 type transport system permease protein
MLSALLYLQYHSFRNRLLSRLKRLKQPKYLVGAIVGGLYFYFYFFRYLFGSGERGAWSGALTSQHLLLAESVGALILFVIVLLAWVIPHERTALTFSEAEVAFLFPAPVSRRGLIHFKLVRSQVRILFTVFLLTLVSNRWGGRAWIHAAGWWLLLSTLNLHFLGSSFARTMLLDRGISNAARRVAVLAVASVLVGVVVVWARRALPGLRDTDLADADSLVNYAQRVLTAGPALYLLEPFRWLIRPYLAANVAAFVSVVGPALVLLAAHYVWVIRSNVAFEEASVAASQKLAARISAARAGNWQGARAARKGRRPLFRLAAVGPPAVALLWKNLISAGQAFTWRIWISLAVMVVVLSVSMSNSPHSPELFTALGIIIGVLLGWSLLLGPQFLRQDLRQDLPLADVLKSYPLRGWQLVLGELLAPVVILSVVQWLLLVSGAGFLLYARGLRDGAMPLAVAAGAALLMPALDALLLLIPNAAVLLFPSWIQTGKDTPRGIEATGQRLILFIGQVLVFALSLVPAGLVFLALFLLIRLALGAAVAVAGASVAAVVVLALEIGAGVALLGRWFERFDLSAELPS